MAAHRGPSPSTFLGVPPPEGAQAQGHASLSLPLGLWLPGVSPGPSHTPQARFPVSPLASSLQGSLRVSPKPLSRSLPPCTVSFLPSFLGLRLM